MILLLTACTSGPIDTGDTADTAAPADLPSVLVELADAVVTDLYLALHFTVGEEVLADMADGAALEGVYTFPDEASPAHWAFDGEAIVDWSVYRRWRSDGADEWEWTMGLSIPSLTLSGGEVSAQGAWAADLVQYDSQVLTEAFMGTVSVAGAEPVEVSFQTVGTWTTVNSVDGFIDGEPVSWENPEPDLP